MSKLIGVILAGGKSRRMGEDKSLMLINGQTMLAHMLMIMSQTQVSKTIVNSRVSSATTNGNEHHIVDCQIQDIIPNKGPLSGIHSALVNFPNDDLLIVPVDMPMLTAASLNSLISHARAQKISCRFTLITANDDESKIKSATMPLYIYNNSEMRQHIEHTLLHSNSLSVYELCSHFPIAQVPLTNASELTNLNYPEQFSQIIKA